MGLFCKKKLVFGDINLCIVGNYFFLQVHETEILRKRPLIDARESGGG